MRINQDTLMKPISSPAPIGGKISTITLPQVFTNRQSGSFVEDKQFNIRRLPPNESFGTETKGNWSPVSQNEKVNIGDILRITYTFRVPFFEKWQTNRFISKLQESNQYELRNWSLSTDEGRLWVEVKVKNLDFGLTAILIALGIAAIGVGIGFWLTTESIEKLLSPVVEGSINLFPFILIIGLFIAAPTLLKRFA